MTIIIDIKNTSVRDYYWRISREKVIIWLIEQKIEHNIINNSSNNDQIEFFDEEDAVLFKLKFS